MLIIGDLVRSVPVGCKPAFDGRIVDVLNPDGFHQAYIVEDENDGSRWHRTPKELFGLKTELPSQRVVNGASE